MQDDLVVVASAVSDKQKPNFLSLRHYFPVLRSLDTCNRLNLICFLANQMTLLVICYYWLQRLYFCLPLRERISCDICLIFHRFCVLGFIASKTTHFLIYIFLKWLLWVFNENERIHYPKKVSQLLNKFHLILSSTFKIMTRSPWKKRILEFIGRNILHAYLYLLYIQMYAQSQYVIFEICNFKNKNTVCDTIF